MKYNAFLNWGDILARRLGERLEPQCISEQGRHFSKENLLKYNAFLNWGDILARRLGEPLEPQCISEQGRHFSKENLLNDVAT